MTKTAPQFSLDKIRRTYYGGEQYYVTYEGKSYIMSFGHDIFHTTGNSHGGTRSTVSLHWDAVINNLSSSRRGEVKRCRRTLKRGDKRLRPIICRTLRALETGNHNAVEM